MAVCLWVLQKCFLLGEGLGAALALKAYINQGAVRIWDGLLMVSPTLAFPPRFKPWPMLTTFLRLGEAPIAPSSQSRSLRWLRPLPAQHMGNAPLVAYASAYS